MLILDKARALDLMVWNAERVPVPEPFLASRVDGAGEAASGVPARGWAGILPPLTAPNQRRQAIPVL